jgi:hypothetical protein
MDQRKKGLNPHFLRNSSQSYQQGKKENNDPNMIDSLGKRPIQQPIKCWGYKRDHMYKHCPHKGDIMRIVHNL